MGVSGTIFKMDQEDKLIQLRITLNQLKRKTLNQSNRKVKEIVNSLILREDQSINRINRIQYYNQNILNKDQKVLRFSINYQKLAHYKKKL